MAAAALVALAVYASASLGADGPFVVNTTVDAVDQRPGDGLCLTSAGMCSVRAATQESNARSGRDEIRIPAGVYEIELPPINDNGETVGDFEITDAVTIEGGGATTIIDGGFPLPGAPPDQRGLDRLFEIHPTAGDVTITDLTLREGYAMEDGGAIQSWTPGTLRLERVHVRDSNAGKSGGGVNNADPTLYTWPSGQQPLQPLPNGHIEIAASTFSGNAASEGGAAINNQAKGRVSIVAGSRIVDNPGEMIPDPNDPPDPGDPSDPGGQIPAPGVYEPGRPAIVNAAEGNAVGTIRVADSTISGNYATADGSAIENAGSGNVTVERSVITDNTSEADGAALHAVGGQIAVKGSTLSHNVADNGGAIYAAGDLSTSGLRGKLTIEGTTIADNRAWASSGGVQTGGDGELVATDVVFDGNHAFDHGGGLSNGDRSSLTLTRAAFKDNRADGEGGGAFLASERPSTVTDATFTANSAGVPGLEGTDAGGGALFTENGPVTVRKSRFVKNTATAEGGAIRIDNHGDVIFTDVEVRENRSRTDGGGVENSGTQVTFERLKVIENIADGDGGGIYNSSSGHFQVLDTTVQGNRATDGGGYTNASDSTLSIRRSLFIANLARRSATNVEDPEDGGHGGGIYSISDGNGLIENTTLSSNRANVRGGGMFHDADASLRLSNVTIWRNSAPAGGGISTVESDFSPTIPPQPHVMRLRNTIIGGSLEGGSCDWYLTSEGGNQDTEDTCLIQVPGSTSQPLAQNDRSRVNPQLDAIADNGGETMTHALRYGSIAIDTGVGCPETDQRGVSRPQNGKCDVGAFEFAGPPPAPDDEPPQTEYLSGPVQDSLETMAFKFTGTDNQTATSELAYECRLVETDLTEAPEPLAPFEPVPPELQFRSCSSPWHTELLEDGLFAFEVRAIDRAGNVDPTPASHVFEGGDLEPPNTEIVEKPSDPTTSRAATFTFSGTDNVTPAQFLEYECRLDSRDPEMWLECFNPAMFSNLTSGEHTMEVRATDGNDNVDPSPARYTWTVGQGTSCDGANITLTPTADGWVDEAAPAEPFLFDTELNVRSDATGGPGTGEPLVGQNARTFVRFDVPDDAAHCELQQATLRMHAGSSTEDRTLEAQLVAEDWRESRLTWSGQPDVRTGTGATTGSGDGYRQWNVTDHVESLIAGDLSNHGWVIRDAQESDTEGGGEQSFTSREAPQDPPETTLPELVLRYEADPAPPPERPTLPADIEPTEVTCGQVLTEHTLVGNDLRDCPGEGLVIGRSGIVVDLGGHTIDGPDYLLENATGQEEGFPAGIRNSGHTNVVIRNGTVQQFGWGVLLTSGTTHNLVTDLRVLRNAVSGVELFDADDGRNGNTVSDSVVKDNELGISLMAGAEGSFIHNNDIQGNLGEQLLLMASHRNRVVGNDIHGIPSDPNLDSDGGVLLDGATENEFSANTMADTGDAGVVVTRGAHDNAFDGDVYMRNGDAGIVIQDSDGTTISDITSHRQSDGGVVVSNGADTEIRDSDLRFNPAGIEATHTNLLVVTGNDASNGLDAGFEIGDGVGILIEDNVANHTGGDGIGLEAAAFDAAGAPIGGAIVRNNTTNENRGDGITVANAGHRIGGNNAHNNGAWGIEAGEAPVAGEPDPNTNTDLGDNRASGNAEAEQCVGVACATGDAVAVEGPDLTAPETTVTSGPDRPTTSTTASFAFTSTDEGTPATAMVYECRLDPPPDPLPEPPDVDPEPPSPNDPIEPPDIDTPPDGEGWAECTSPVTYHDLDPGEHHFEVRALDQGDNRDLTPATYDWAIETLPDGGDGPDASAPDTRLTEAPPAITTSTAARFAFNGTDNATPGPYLRYECRVDSSAAADFTDCASPELLEGLPVGEHTFEVRAVDRSGNADESPALHAWEIRPESVDTVPPQTTIDTGPDRTTVETSATFTFSSDDAEATFECSLDGAVYVLCTPPETLTGLAVGSRELRVRAIDRAGNADPTPARYAWTITVAPVDHIGFCGQVITRSIRLVNDLHDCQYDGLVVGAPSITIDLNGHTIDGLGQYSAIRNDGHDSVTVKGGNATEFDYGVALNTGTRLNIVDGLRLELNQEAAVAIGQPPMPDPLNPIAPPELPASGSGADDNIVRSVTALSNGEGIWVSSGARRTIVRDSSLAGTQGHGVWLETAIASQVHDVDVAEGSGYGVALQGASDTVVRDVTLSGNDGGGVLLGQTDRLTPGVPSERNRVERASLDESGGIEVLGSSANEIVDNVVRRSSEDAVNLEYATETLVRANDLAGNKQGIGLTASSDNRLEDNDTSDSGSTGITLEALSLRNVLVGNRSSGNDGDGIYVGDEAAGDAGTLIEGNTASDNKTVGINVPKVAHTIRGNTANDNGSWGIYVSEGSNGRVNVDGGGNRAQGNNGPPDPTTLSPLQCFTVRCATGDPGTPSDRTPPETTILDGPPASTAEERATFRFTGSDASSAVRFECRVDNDHAETFFQPCDSPKTVTAGAGQHTFEVRAIDGSGNVDASPATQTWTVTDRPAGDPPETTIVSGPDATTVSTEATFELAADERGSMFECALDGAAFLPCDLLATPGSLLDASTTTVSFAGLAVGSHDLLVRATDGDGNTDPTPAAHAWRIMPAPVAAEVSCGEIVMQSILLASDLVDCPGHALIVGAPDITIDLDGHVVDGAGAEAGILNNGHDSVTVTNGVVHQFEYGVQLAPGSGENIVSHLHVEANQEAGIALADADDDGRGSTVRDNFLIGNGIGIAAFSSTRNAVIRNNDLRANTADAIRVDHSRGATIESNTILDAGAFGVVMEGGGEHTVVENELRRTSGDGIAVGGEELPSDRNRVERNTLRETSGAGISVTDSTSNEVLLNVVRDGTGAGLALSLARNTIVRANDVRASGSGIALEESFANRIESNNASGTFGAGIELGTAASSNVVLLNTANGNAGEGIAIADSAPTGAGNLVDRNTTDANAGDGILVDGVGHTVGGNRASTNGGWGIYAPVGVTDGGGNFAVGNVEPQQCLGVVCETGAAPGAPDTEITQGPPATTDSRSAAILYTGVDDTTAITELVFECRIDTTNDTAWEDCEYPAEYRNLSPGQHFVDVRAVDLNQQADATPARHTWTIVDGDPERAPVVTIDRKPPAETWVPEALFTFASDESDVVLECRIDTLPYEPCGFDTVLDGHRGAYEAALEETQVGPHTFRVRAIDRDGNIGVAEYTWRLAGVVTSFTSGPGFTPGSAGEPATGGESTSSTATIAFATNVADATFECSLDLEPYAPCTSPVTAADLLPGDHQLRVVATDSEGRQELEPAVYEWEVLDTNDGIPPETTIERAPPSGSSSTIFEFIGTDNITPSSQLTYQCRLDSTSELDWEACQSPLNLLDLYTYADLQMAPGSHTFEVRAVDAADPAIPDPSNPNFEGNVDPTPATYTWTSVADTTAPGTAFAAGPIEGSPAQGARTGETEAVFEFLGSDNATPDVALTYECSLDGDPYAPCDSPETVGSLAPGEHTFRVRAVDLAGNVDGTPATRTWTVVPAPVTTFSSGPPANATTEQAVFEFTADQTGSTFECSLDGADFRPCSSPEAAWVVDSGAHELEVRATNPEGIVEDPPASFAWNVTLGPDATRPDTEITAHPPTISPDTVATFRFTGSDNRTPDASLSFECALDGTAYNSCTSPQQFSDLTRGQHALSVRAIDAAGNMDSSPARYEWTVAPPPETVVLTGPDSPMEGSTATFTFESDVPGSTFECWLDGPKGPCTSPVSYEDLLPGEHIFAVRAIDPHGQANPVWTEYDFAVGDVTPPLTTITSGPDAQTTSTSATFAFVADEAGVRFECVLDGGVPFPCTSPHTYPRLHPGEHRFEVRAIAPLQVDPFGQPIEQGDPVSAVYTWTIVDETPPDTAVEFGPNASTASPNAYFGFSSTEPTAQFECSLDGAAYSSCEAPAAYTELATGAHDLNVRAVDLAGNVDPTPAAYEWTITGPGLANTPGGTNVVVTLPMPGGPGNASVTFGEVTLPGATALEALNGGPALPPGFSAAGARYLELTTTAEVSSPITVCLPYTPATFGTPSVKLLAFDGSLFEDLTLTNDPSGRVCAEVEEPGLLAIAASSGGGTPESSIVSGPANPSTSGTATFTFFTDQAGAMLQCSIDGEPFVGCTSPVTYRWLESGDHQLQVQAINALGMIDPTPALYEWTVELPPDTTPPETTITKGPPALSGSYAFTAAFSGEDNQTHPLELDFECTLDGAPLGGCSVPFDGEVLTPGAHTLEVAAIDEAGNVDPTPAVRRWTVVDVTAPDTSIDAGPDSETTATTATFQFTGEEPDGTPVTAFECALDGADFASCTSPETVSSLAPGPHIFEVRARDLAGNVDITPDVYEWTILGPEDTAAPQTTIVSAPDGTTGPEVRFGFSSNELVQTYECSLDGGPFEACDAVHELTGLAAGDHTLAVRAVDLLDNVDPTPVTHAWTSVGVPQTRLLSAPSSPSPYRTPTFTFDSDQDEVTFQCAVDDGEWTPCTSPFDVGPLTNLEEHTFAVRAISRFTTLEGEQIVDETPAEHGWLVDVPPDVPPPDTMLLTAPPAVVPAGEGQIVSFTFQSNDPLASFECSLDGAAFEECEPPHELDNLAEGLHVFEVRAFVEGETVTLVDAEPARHEFRVEATPDTTLLSASPAPETDATTATFTFSSDRPGVTFECSLDGALYATCSSGKTYTDVPYGRHEFLVRAKAEFGTFDPDPASFEWESGHLVAPTMTLDQAPPLSTTGTSATFEFSSPDPEARFLCSLDSGPQTVCDPAPAAAGADGPVRASKTYENLMPGEHTFTVEPTKPNLLVSGEAVTHTWTVVDDTPPETVVTGGPANPTAATEAAIAFTGTDAGTAAADLRFECALDDAAFGSCSSPYQASSLAPGEHVVQVRAVDASDNTDASPAEYRWTVVGAPTTTIAGPAGATSDLEATLTFTADQTGTTFECSLDGGAFETCTSPFVARDLADGPHELEVRATNGFGLVEDPPASHTWSVELPAGVTRPETTIDSGPADPSASTSAAFEFSSDQAGSTFECALDGAAYAACDAATELTGLDEGLRVLRVRAVSPDGVRDATPAEHEWTIDLPPETTIESGPDAETVATSATFAFASDDPLAGFECALDSDSFGSCEATTDLTDLTVGSHTLQVRAVDDAGNADPTPATRTWTITPLPETTIGSGPDEATESTTASFAFSSDVPDATFQCALDQTTTWIACESGVEYTGLALGEHELQVRARDGDGHFDPTPAVYQWEIGDVPPEVSFSATPDATTESRSATFEFDGGEPLLEYECSLDGAAWQGCTSPRTFTSLSLGNHALEVRVIAPEAIVEPPISTHRWQVVDTIAPDTTIDSGPAAQVGPGEISVAFTSDDPGATFECALDGAAYEACESPETFSGLQPGQYALSVRAVDEAGNFDDSPAAWTWTVVEEPETTITAQPESTTATTDATFAFESDVPFAGFECALDGGAYADCTSPVTFTALPDGEHRFQVRATRLFGITDQSPEEYRWTVDASAPQTTIASGPESPTVSTIATFTLSSSEAGSTFECSLDDAEWVECESPHQVGAAPGERQLRVRATDNAGNVDPTPATYGWTVVAPDTAAPETTIDEQPPAVTGATDATFRFTADEQGATFECALDGGTYVSCASPHVRSGLAAGEHELRIRATDAAGNVESTPATATWRVDTSAPETELGSGAPAATTTSTSAAFAFSSPESGATFECSIDGGTWTACTSPKAYSGLALGSHEFRVRAEDAAGNADPTPARYEWLVHADCGAATITRTAVADAWIDEGSPAQNKGTDSTLKVTSKSPANDTRALMRFDPPTRPQGCDVKTATLRVNAASAAGGRTLEARRIAAGWTENGVQWGSQPATTGTAATVSSGTGNRDFVVTGQLQAMYDGGAHHGFLIKDAVENQDAEQQLRSREAGSNRPQLIVTFGPPDRTPPETTIDTKPDATTTSRTGTFTFSASEAGSTYECALDGAAFAACASPKQYTGLGLGEHDVLIRAKDPQGNVDPTPASHSWTIEEDTRAPETTLGSGAPAATTTSTSATFAFTADEGDVTFECSLDGAAYAGCASPKAYSGLSLGGHDFRVRARDGSGNVDGTPATHAWTIEDPGCTAAPSRVGADRDSWVLQSSATSTFGSDSTLKVDSKSGANARALVRFALPAVPAGCEVATATLRMYTESAKSGRTLQALRLTGSWTESAVTWNTQPGSTGTAATVPSRSSAGWLEWAVTAQVGSMYAGTNNGFLLRDATEGGGGNEQALSSREKGTNRPELVVTWR